MGLSIVVTGGVGQLLAGWLKTCYKSINTTPSAQNTPSAYVMTACCHSIHQEICLKLLSSY